MPIPIPGNDDAARAIALYCDLAARAIIDGLGQGQTDAGVDLGAAEVLAGPDAAPPTTATAGSARAPKHRGRNGDRHGEHHRRMVKDLRDKTGAGMMDCKTALNETDGDMEAAIDWLRKKGISKAAKKAGRAAAEGLVGVAVGADAGALVEVNAETDFVARNDEFKAFVKAAAELGAEGRRRSGEAAGVADGRRRACSRP